MNNSSFLPLWGPYGKKYAGISKITRVEGHPAARFDFLAVPGVMGFDIRLPNVTVPSAYHPWEASPDLGFQSYRHELEWKDRVFADVSYARIDEHSVLCRTELVNNSEKTKNFVVNFFYSLELPVGKPFEPLLPEKCDFLNACDYSAFEYASPRPWDRQNPDGMKKGVFPDHRFSSGEGLGDRIDKWHVPHKKLMPFGAVKGDRVSYNIVFKHSYDSPVLVVRYRSVAIEYVDGEMDKCIRQKESKDSAVFSVLGKKLVLPPSNGMAYSVLPLNKLEKELVFVSEGTGAVEFDFFAVVEQGDEKLIISKNKNEAPQKAEYIPETEISAGGGFLMHSKYAGCEDEFFLRIYDENTRFRKVESGCLEDCLSARMSNADESFDDLTESFTGAFSRKHSDNGFFENTITHMIFVEPGKAAVRYAVISDREEKARTIDELERIYLEAKKTAVGLNLNPDGEKYDFSVRLLSAALLTNVVYPIYKHGDYIIHFTPGKRWDCLYTWDAGFIGMGMNEIAPRIADYVLDTYLSEENNSDYAFLHHGSPVPTQAYQFFEMLQKAKDKSTLLSLYPRLRLYYLFLAGKLAGSTTARFRSGLLTTYDYFYSASGMDDYPAQVAMMKDGLRDTAAPVITTATAIRFAKILSIAADLLGKLEDKEEYSKDISRFTEALNSCSWDAESGYFGYVLHDEYYEPKGIYRTESGENLSKGLDGVYPVISGICSKEQKDAILSHLKNEKEMMSPFGISAVDQSAEYFRVNGYWNGNIWFPHQWILWKAMLDMGEADFAFEIARRALEIWKREVEDSYYTFEMVSVTTGSGGWFHNFGGLSSPILLWAKAYYAPGMVNVGFDALVESAVFNNDFTSAEVKLRRYGEKGQTVLAVLAPGRSYSAKINGLKAPLKMRTDGCAEISVCTDENEATIVISEEKNNEQTGI